MALNMFNSTMPRLVNPTTAVDDSPQRLWGEVTNTLNQFANRQMAEWQEATLKKASKQGALEGQKENPEFREGTSMASEVFNQSATKNYMAGLEVQSSARMAEIQQANLYNPSGYQKAAGNYINTLTEKVKQNPATAEFAGMMNARLKLQSQAEGYKISKNYMVQQGEETKANNEALFSAARESAYMAASGVFSKDPAVQDTAIGAYKMNKKIIETALHAVMPDGTPLYSPMAIQKRLEAYHQEFFVKGAQAYLADNTSNADLKSLTDGTFAVTLPTGEKIDLIREVGVDAYERQVRDFAFQNIKMKEAERTRQEAAYTSYAKEVKQANGLEMMSSLLSGSSSLTPSVIMSEFKAGRLTASDAMAAVKLASDPEAGLTNSETVVELQMKIVDGENVQDQIKQLAKSGQIKPDTMKKLLVENAKAQQGVVDDNKRFIKQLVVEKDSLTGLEDPRTLRHAYDFQQQYDQMIEEGTSPELALEKVRNNIDVIKARSNMRKYNSVPLYMKVGPDNEIDVTASIAETVKRQEDGFITEEQMDIEVDRLRKIKIERNKK